MSRRSTPEVVLPPPPPPEWRLRPAPESSAVQRLSRELSLPPSICALLVAREVVEPDAAKHFLRPSLDDLHPPEAMPGMEEAVTRILAAVRSGEHILVHGDFDVDGVCGAALFTRWLRRMGGRVTPFVPHRLRDGYDLGPAGLARARDSGATLLVTCDTGILAHDAVSSAQAAGIDVIVTDHHTPGPELPPAVAVVNPNQPDSTYPEGTLSGAGVAFKLCQALAARAGIGKEELWPHLDIVALATVADLVPLTGENRILVRFGLRFLACTRKVGLEALLQVSGVTGQSTIEAGQVGFILAPRMNAAGRMGDATRALRLLLTEDPGEAEALARELDEANRARREEEKATLAQALDLLAGDFDPERHFGVVLAGEGWHPGVIGIVASRVVERIHRPVVMVALSGDRGRGSARSISGVHLFRALEGCRRYLLRFGGHAQAAGMDLRKEALDPFRDAFNEAVWEQLGGEAPRPMLTADLAIPLADAGAELYGLIRHAGPFGIGNPRPVFWATGLDLATAPRVVGDGHLKLRLKDGSASLDAIGFGLADRVGSSLGGGLVDALFQLREDEYRGIRRLQARLLDVRASGSAVPTLVGP